MDKLAELRKSDGVDPKLTKEELANLRKEEKLLRKDMLRAALNHGNISKEKAEKMHRLGRNLFQQQRYSSIYQLAWDILDIHAKIDGTLTREYVQAMTNVASTAWKIKERHAAQIITKRQIGIWQELGEPEEGKDIMMARARLMSYQDKAQVKEGLTHEQYVEMIAPYELSSPTDTSGDRIEL
jgi:hypothetical protein